MSNIEVKKMDLKLKEGHAVCFDFDGVIHKYLSEKELEYQQNDDFKFYKMINKIKEGKQ